MAEATKSVLLLDYDSIHRSVSARDAAAGECLASRLGSWVGAIETGSLFAAKPANANRRRVLIRRCYADPKLLGDNRAAFLSSGFQVIDCPPAEGREHNAADIHMVLDAIDALGHPTGYDEFILLSADSDLTPLMIRLRAHNRTTAIFTTALTAESYKAIADAMIEEQRFVAALTSDSGPAAEETEEQARQSADRSEIEALARKVSSATNVPLFAPRTFAELFRRLVEEIAENGYHFQTTAENVATRMAEAGRNVSRRQVVFVVKGLALKGHVFSTGDTPERLAEVFCEQVLYLADNAGLALDENERQVLSSWIVGKVPAGATRDEDLPNAGSQSGSNEAEAAKSGNGQASRPARRKPLKQTVALKPHEAKPAEVEPPKAATTEPSSPKPPEEGKVAAAPRQEAAPAPSKSVAPPAPSPSATTTGSTSAATERPATLTGAVASTPSASRPATPAPKSASRSQEADEDSDADAVESSILAAIAQAVDVLVEDSGGKSRVPAESDEARPGPGEKKEPPAQAEAEAEESTEGDDIGDEIQRIIASYSRNRKQDSKQ